MNENYEQLHKGVESFVALNSRGEDITCTLPLDELIYLDSRGKLYLSSLNGGIVRYDYENDKYIKCYYFTKEEVDISELKDIVLEED